MAIFDQLGSMFSRRMDQAMMPFTNPGGYMDQRMDRRFGDLYESDEERRRREEEERRRMEQVTGPVAPPAPDQQYEAQGLQEGPAGQAMAGFRKPQPFKQTLTTDPVTGQQTMKMEGAPQDFTAANPRTPTMVSGPAIPDTGPTPDEIMREQEQARQYQQMMGQPPAVTQPAAPPPTAAAPVAPGGVAQPAPQAQQDTTRLGLQASQVVPGDQAQTQAQAIQPPPAAPTSQPRDLTQMAQAPGATATDVTAGTTGAVAPPPAAQPAAAAPPAPAPAAAPPAAAATLGAPPPSMIGGPMATQLAQTAVGGAGTQYGDALTANADNPSRLLDLSRDPMVPQNWQRVYAERAKRVVEAEDNKRKGEAAGEKAVESGRGLDRINRKDHEPNSIGFYAKQYLLRRLGLNKEADQELLKTTSTYQKVTDSQGNAYEIEVRGDGLLMGGVDSEGKQIDRKKLIEVGAQAALAKTTAAGKETYADPSGKVKGNFILETRPGGSVFREVGTQRIATAAESSVLRKMGVKGTLEDQLAERKQALDLKLAYIAPEVAAKVVAEEEAVSGPLPPAMRAAILANAGSMIRAPGAGGAAPGQAAPAPAAQPPAAPAPAPAAPSGGAVAPGPAPSRATAPVAPAPAPAAAPALAPAGGGTIGARRDTRKIAAAGAEAEATAAGRERGESLEQLRQSRGSNEAKVDRALDQMAALFDPNREGKAFESTVGATMLPGARFLPFGTPQRDFSKLVDEIKSGAFLQGIREMKGFGALTNQEGQAAREAITRLDVSLSEDAFRRAANDYLDIIRRGVDRDRAKLGLPAKYGTPDATERSALDQKMIKELQDNPNNPRAPEIRKRLRERGYDF